MYIGFNLCKYDKGENNVLLVFQSYKTCECLIQLIEKVHGRINCDELINQLNGALTNNKVEAILPKDVFNVLLSILRFDEFVDDTRAASELAKDGSHGVMLNLVSHLMKLEDDEE